MTAGDAIPDSSGIASRVQPVDMELHRPGPFVSQDASRAVTSFGREHLGSIRSSQVSRLDSFLDLESEKQSVASVMRRDQSSRLSFLQMDEDNGQTPTFSLATMEDNRADTQFSFIEACGPPASHKGAQAKEEHPDDSDQVHVYAIARVPQETRSTLMDENIPPHAFRAGSHLSASLRDGQRSSGTRSRLSALDGFPQPPS